MSIQLTIIRKASSHSFIVRNLREDESITIELQDDRDPDNDPFDDRRSADKRQSELFELGDWMLDRRD